MRDPGFRIQVLFREKTALDREKLFGEIRSIEGLLEFSEADLTE